MTYPSEHTILIVDDEPSIRVYMERALSLEGYRVVVAANGQEALDRAATQVFDAVLLDNNMPGLSGLEVLPQLHRDHPNTAIVMVSAEAGLDTTANAMKAAGAFDCITKPINLDDLLMVVARACGQSH